MSFNEKEIIKRAKNGDKEASRVLYDENNERIFRFLSKKIRTDPESLRLKLDPRDLSQITWLKALRGLQNGKLESDDNDGFVRFLYTIARNEFLNARKKAIRYSRLVKVEMSFDSETGDEETWDNYRSEPQMELSDYLERQERIDILHEAILTLRDPYKSIIVLELADVPRREIGKKLKFILIPILLLISDYMTVLMREAKSWD